MTPALMRVAAVTRTPPRQAPPASTSNPGTQAIGAGAGAGAHAIATGRKKRPFLLTKCIIVDTFSSIGQDKTSPPFLSTSRR